MSSMDEGAMDTPEETPGSAPAARPRTPSMGMGESMVGLGAAVVILVEIFGSLIFDRYSLWDSALLGAIAALALVMSRKSREASPLPYGWTLAVIGAMEGIVAIWELLDGLRGSWLRGWTIFFYFVYLIGAILMWFGGRQVRSTTPAAT